MTVEISPLPGTMGAEVTGVDLSRPVDAETALRLNAAWLDRILLLFRDQTLSDDALHRSADWLGAMSTIHMPVERRGDADTAIALISNIVDGEGRPIGALGDGDMWFHHDNSFTPEPDKATWLYGVEIPTEGGDTLFADCHAAWDALPDRLQGAIAGRRVLQVYDYTVREVPDLSALDGVPHCWQPAVVRHPENGRAALYIDRLMSAAIEGYDDDEGAALLAEIFPYVERSDYVHQWRLGDYVIWDNRNSAHARTDYPADQRRLLKRGKVKGTALDMAEVQGGSLAAV
ncbi:MAG: TauD/TfdA family dioxygenase [Alphaproteobacteria bacterium]